VYKTLVVSCHLVEETAGLAIFIIVASSSFYICLQQQLPHTSVAVTILSKVHVSCQDATSGSSKFPEFLEFLTLRCFQDMKNLSLRIRNIH